MNPFPRAPRPADVPDADWCDAGWQLRHRIRTAEELARYVDPAPDEVRAIGALAERFRFVITPYYAALMDRSDPSGFTSPEARAATLGEPDLLTAATGGAPALAPER